MKVAIITLGCKVNQADSSSIRGILKDKGYEIVSEGERPDICIVNTCTVTAKSDYESRQKIRRAVKSGARVIATGCYAQVRPTELSQIKGVNMVVGNSHKDILHDYVDILIQRNGKKTDDAEIMRHEVIRSDRATCEPLTLKPYFSQRTRAFLKIQDGCNFSCSYCAVPRARGKSRSLSVNDVIKAARAFNTQGYKEIVLTGIHVGSYGSDLEPASSLLDIVRKINMANLDIRLRVSSIEPQEFNPELLSLMNEGKICPHLHIPLQSGSDKILRAMNRRYTVLFYKELINKIVSACPDISIGTDVVVGFPGEDDREFEETRKAVEDIPFSYIHVFPYSRRPYTNAFSLPEQIRESTKKERVRIISHISDCKKNNYILRQIGRQLEVIVERKHITPYSYVTFSDNYLRPLVRDENLILGQRLKINVISCHNGELLGMRA